MTDTISAIATANGIGSIAIIRVSGDRALSIAKSLSKKENCGRVKFKIGF